MSESGRQRPLTAEGKSNRVAPLPLDSLEGNSTTLHVKDIVRQIGGDKRNKRLVQILEELDRDGSGTIDVPELLSHMEGVVNSRRERKYMCLAIIVMLAFGLILIGTIVGLTYALLYSLKDTEVKGGIMYAKNSDGIAADIIRTGSAEFGVSETGLFMQRLPTANSGAAAVNATDSGTVLRTATFMGTPQAFNSELDIKSLLELKYLLLNGTGKAQLGLVVLGVARVPMEGSVYGTVLHIVTVTGTITLDATVITFSSTIANIFAEAGFRVSSTRRVLLGAYTVLGFFNTIKDLSASGKPPGMPEPRLPSTDFVMKLKIYEPCVTPAEPDVDRCVYMPPIVNASESPSPPPSPPSPAANRSPPHPAARPSPPPHPAPRPSPAVAGRRRVLQSSSEKELPADEATPVSGGGQDGSEMQRRSLRRHRWVATAPIVHASHSRVLQEFEGVALDLAGVELYKGERYMTHMETTYSYGESIRVAYEFPLYPGWQKVEVSTNSKDIQSWQETVPPEESTNPVEHYFCRNFTLPSAGVAGFNASSVLNYTYIGVDTIGDDVLARHFEMYVTQLSSTKPGQTDILRIDYWDRLDNNTPLRFEFRTADIGLMAIDVVEVRNITSTSPEAAPAMFVAPSAGSCPTSTRLPRLSTAFMARGEMVNVDPPKGADPATSRRLLDYTNSLAPQWEQLDHANGTGDWPQWALDMYGGVHPTRRTRVAERRLLSASVLTPCGLKVSYPYGIGVCEVEVALYQYGDFGISAACTGSIGPVSITGSLEVDTCETKLKGCLSVSVGLPSTNWLVKKLGVDLDIDIGSVCVGYNYKEKIYFLEAVLSLNIIIAKAELSMEMDFSSCCIWIPAVTLEASVGVSFLGVWVTLGSVDLVTDVYLRGSPEVLEAEAEPTAINLVGNWLTVSDGFWGNWGKTSYPCTKISYNSDSGEMELLGLPINSYQLRMEAYKSSTDQSALNGIQVGCLSGSSDLVEDGNGFWGGWTNFVSCPVGGYFVGAKMRIEPQQGWRDDTAANSIVFTCSNQRGTDLNAHSGFYGGWTGYTYCPGNSYICGLQIRFEENQGSFADDTALNGVRIACCGFPSGEFSALVSTNTIRTNTVPDQSMCLDVPNNDQSAGAALQQWSCDEGAPSQQFTLKSTGAGTFAIAVAPGGSCLTLQGANVDSGTLVVLDSCSDDVNQAWAVRPAGQGIYSLKPARNSNQCLDIMYGSGDYGAGVQIWECNGSPAQTFWLDFPTASKTGIIQTMTTDNRCMDVSGNVHAPGTPIIQWECHKLESQQFTITTAGTNTYQIVSARGLCVTIPNSSADGGTSLVLDTCSDGAMNQLFQASVGYQGGLALSPLHAWWMCIDVKSGSTAPGATMWIWTCNRSLAQSLKLTLPV